MAKTKKAPPKGNEFLENPQALADQLTKTEEFIEKNQKAVYIFAGIIVLVIAGVFGYRYYIGNQNDLAQNEMFQAVFYFEADSLGQALNGDGLNYGFLDVISEYPGTKAANLAYYYSGAIYMLLGDYESALRNLDNFDGGGHILQAQAFALTGEAYMELKDYEQAAQNFTKAANFKANDEFSPLYLQKAALAYEKSNKLKDALEAYSTIIEKYFESTQFQDARKHKARLEMLMKS
ncbi:MAG: cytochrome C biosynthesis protein [Bacteroidetes bacterium]|nr:cytochrome C biosynthesis protein [Bacteroidota bacterium]MDA1119028.1 cytochrome C biosynthesis protein [Bacteroidota bacterium]